MKYYGKAENVATAIIKAFETGSISSALAQVFIHRNDNVPCRAWSWTNQMITALIGVTSDARGYKQWQKVERHVKKGGKSFSILGPCMAKVEDKKTGEKKSVLVGFRSIAVFPLEQTEGEALAVDKDAEDFLDALPLRNVAQEWGLSVQSFNGRKGSYLGKYKHGQAIALGVKNVAVWAHELVHAADDKLGTITKGFGQNAGNEIVAELGGTILLECLGEKVKSDRGGAWTYIKSYAKNDDAQALSLAMKLIDRTCKAVALILETTEQTEAKAA